jgi:hypothetical protein
VIKLLVALQVPDIDVHEILQAHRRHVIEVMQRYSPCNRRPYFGPSLSSARRA